MLSRSRPLCQAHRVSVMAVDRKGFERPGGATAWSASEYPGQPPSHRALPPSLPPSLLPSFDESGFSHPRITWSTGCGWLWSYVFCGQFWTGWCSWYGGRKGGREGREGGREGRREGERNVGQDGGSKRGYLIACQHYAHGHPFPSP
jgi:hypothetical protein